MTEDIYPLEPIAPADFRYIKLGVGNSWATSALDNGRLEYGVGDAPDELVMSGNEGALRAFYEQSINNKGAITRFVNMICEFYELGEDCLWVTFANGLVWWAFAEAHVIDLGGDGTDHAERARRVIGKWRCTDIKGRPLDVSAMSSLLTSTAGTRAAICTLKGRDYLLARINCTQAPYVSAAKEASEALVQATEAMLSALHWRDVEVLTDLLFARLGWQRVTEVGGTQKDVDLILEQPATGERAFVQVKSGSDQRTLDDYIELFGQDASSDRFFFICTNPRIELKVPTSGSYHLWSGEPLARMVVRAGLADWVLTRAV